MGEQVLNTSLNWVLLLKLSEGTAQSIPWDEQEWYSLERGATQECPVIAREGVQVH